MHGIPLGKTNLKIRLLIFRTLPSRLLQMKLSACPDFMIQVA